MQRLVMREARRGSANVTTRALRIRATRNDSPMSRHELLSGKLGQATEPCPHPFFLTSHEPSFKTRKAGEKGTDWLATVYLVDTTDASGASSSQIPGFR